MMEGQKLDGLARLPAVIERGVDSLTVTRINYCSGIVLSTSISLATLPLILIHLIWQRGLDRNMRRELAPLRVRS
jgi:hypothetical protein